MGGDVRLLGFALIVDASTAAGARLQCGRGAAALVRATRSISSSTSSLMFSCRLTRSPAAIVAAALALRPGSSSSSPADLFRDRDIEAADNFSALPVLWNLAAFYLDLLQPSNG